MRNQEEYKVDCKDDRRQHYENCSLESFNGRLDAVQTDTCSGRTDAVQIDTHLNRKFCDEDMQVFDDVMDIERFERRFLSKPCSLEGISAA